MVPAGAFATGGRTGDGAHGFHCANAFERNSNYGGDHHAVLDALEELFASEMSIVLGEHLIGELHHLETAYAQTFFFQNERGFLP